MCFFYAADCRDPGIPSNGRRIGNNFNHGKQVTFECSQGFVLVGNSTSVCHKGKWSHVVPNCKGNFYNGATFSLSTIWLVLMLV